MRRNTLPPTRQKIKDRDNCKDSQIFLRDLLWQKLVIYIKKNCCDYVYVNRWRQFMSV